MKLTKADKEMLEKCYANVWGDNASLVDYCVKKASGYIAFGDDIFVMDKPSIKTEFWFGEHTYDYEEVCERCSEAKNDIDYFVEQNLDGCEAHRFIREIDEGRRAPYISREYSSYDNSNFVFINWRRPWDSTDYDIRKLDDDEIAALRLFCKDEVEKFERRLTSYLKRYGLSKCHFGVYWADR